jgi:hypothetical protein
VEENPYFVESAALEIKHDDCDTSDHTGPHPQADNNVQLDSENVGLKNGDITFY